MNILLLIAIATLLQIADLCGPKAAWHFGLLLP